MLILSRRPGDAILIDGGIRIVVLATDGRGVRLGIEAPAKIGIVREEVVERIAEENRRAGSGGGAREWIEGLKRKDGTPPQPTDPAPDPASD